MKKLPLTLQFIINSFLVAILINTTVVTAHILHGKENSFPQSLQILFFFLGISALFFAAVYVVLYLFASMSARISHEKIFWFVMLIGIAGTVAAFLIFEEVFTKFTDAPGIIAAIAAFSILVSLSSQYQLFAGEEEAA